MLSLRFLPRRGLIMRYLLSLFLFFAAAPATAEELNAAEDLAALGQRAASENKAILVFYYQPKCHYCEAVRKSFLRPILGNPSYSDRLFLRKVNIQSADNDVRDFDGQETTHAGLAQKTDVGLTPTVAFYGPEGSELADSLVGLKGGRDYYGHYLDKGIDTAARAVTDGDS